MHAVAEIDVPPPRGAEHHGVPPRHALRPVAGEVVGPEVGLRLMDDVPRDAATGPAHDERGPDQVPRHPVRGAREEVGGQGL